MRLILPVLLLASIATRAAEPSSQEALPELETVVVTGVQPGPALWKVTRKDHTLWILPTYGPLPVQLVWKSSQVDAVIADSQEVYAEARISVDQPTDLKSRARMLKAASNVDGKVLAEVMPADLHARFVRLSEKFAGGSAPFERFRPFQAMDLLQDAAMRRLQLTSDGGMYRTVNRLADSHGVNFRALKPLRSRDWEKIVADLEKTPREADMACVTERIDRIETDLQEAVERANEWARGDLSNLRRDVGVLNGGADMAACQQFFMHLKSVRQNLSRLRKFTYSSYEKALRKNRSTLVLISIGDLFDADGLLATLKKDGYRVEEP